VDVVTAVLLNDNSHPSRQPNRHRHPNPKVDVLTAVRYSLQHDVSAALATPPVEGLTRKKLGALKAWLHALHHWLPQQSDGGVHATGAGELISLLGSGSTLPTPSEWDGLLKRAGLSAPANEWVACNSSQPQLHAYPCSLWLLFHTLLAHASEPDALTTLQAITSYVINFFGCQECVGHFAVLAASLENNLRDMAMLHPKGRDRAALWLWTAHNKVNERLTSEEASVASRNSKFHEFVKVQWPPRTGCATCQQMSRPLNGAPPEAHWQSDEVLHYLMESYCLDPRYECWTALAHARSHKPAAEVSATYGLYALYGIAVLIVASACCCGRGQNAPCAAATGGKRKTDHVV